VISALVQGGDNTTDFLEKLEADLEAILDFREHNGAGVRVDVLEVRLPPTVVSDSPEAISRLFEEAAQRLAFIQPTLAPFYELPLGLDWRSTTPSVIEALAAANARGDQRPPAGLKLRCGGLEAAAFPSCEQIARVLALCCQAGAPLKATAGLHHPLRHFDSELQVAMHGFLNVFGAGILAQARHLPEARLRALLEDQDASHFCFTPTGFSWQDCAASLQEIIQARGTAIVSFGSCSFDEPREDLRALGWL
jgi:hypothetical protein